MKKIALILAIAVSPLIAGDTSVLIHEVKEEMRPIFQDITEYASNPQKGMLVELVTGMSPERIVSDNKQELRELSDMFAEGKISFTEFCEGTYDVRAKLPMIIADEEKYTISFACCDGSRESVIAFYDEL